MTDRTNEGIVIFVHKSPSCANESSAKTNNSDVIVTSSSWVIDDSSTETVVNVKIGEYEDNLSDDVIKWCHTLICPEINFSVINKSETGT